MTGKEVREWAVELLNECLDIIDERGKQYGNASLEDPGMLSGRSAEDTLLTMVEVKLNRLRNDVLLGKPPKRDTIIDLCNYLAFYYARSNG